MHSTMDYEIQRCTRRCATTERDLRPGEVFFSVLEAHGTELVRHDYCAEAWQGPPEGAVGWWKARMPDASAGKSRLAPNDVILELFEQLAEQPDRQDMRYVLALLLVRRRVVRQAESQTDESGGELLVLYCPRRDATFQVPAVMPDAQRIEQIQYELAALLFAGTQTQSPAD
jgi:hypothetical protein